MHVHIRTKQYSLLTMEIINHTLVTNDGTSNHSQACLLSRVHLAGLYQNIYDYKPPLQCRTIIILQFDWPCQISSMLKQKTWDRSSLLLEKSKGPED